MKPTTFPPTIKSDVVKIFLEAYSAETQLELWQAIREDREYPTRKGSWPAIKTFEDLSAYMNSCDINNPRSQEFGYLIRDKNRNLVGTFHVFSVDWKAEATEVGYGLQFQYLGKGFATMALSLMETELRRMGFEKIKIRCQQWNIKSWALAERAQYVLQSMRHEDRECPGCDDCTRSYEKVLS